MVRPGQRMDIRFNSVKIVTDRDLASVPMKKRGCVMPQEETTGALTAVYSAWSCRQERKLETLLDACGCHSWTFPYLENDGEEKKPLCDLRGEDCYLARKGIADAGEECEDPCETTTFTTFTKSIALNAKAECLNEVANASFPNALLNLAFIEPLEDLGEDNLDCLAQMRSTAVITVKSQTPR